MSDFKIKAYRGVNGTVVVIAALQICKRLNRDRTGRLNTAKVVLGTFKRANSELEILRLSVGAWDGTLWVDPQYLHEGELETVILTPEQRQKVKDSQPHKRK
jgi:hypothetical protein